jgi:hypothetical protein
MEQIEATQESQIVEQEQEQQNNEQNNEQEQEQKQEQKQKRKYVKKVKPPFEELPLEKKYEIETKLYTMPKQRTEKQKIQFAQMQEKQQERWAEKRRLKSEKIKEMVLKQIEVEKRNQTLNHRKIRKISNAIIDDEFAIDDRQVLKNIIEKEKQQKVEINYSRFF